MLVPAFHDAAASVPEGGSEGVGRSAGAGPSQHKGSLSGRQVWRPGFVAAFDVCIIIPRFSELSTGKILFSEIDIVRETLYNKDAKF